MNPEGLDSRLGINEDILDEMRSYPFRVIVCLFPLTQTCSHEGTVRECLVAQVRDVHDFS